MLPRCRTWPVLVEEAFRLALCVTGRLLQSWAGGPGWAAPQVGSQWLSRHFGHGAVVTHSASPPPAGASPLVLWWVGPCSGSCKELQGGGLEIGLSHLWPCSPHKSDVRIPRDRVCAGRCAVSCRAGCGPFPRRLLALGARVGLGAGAPGGGRPACCPSLCLACTCHRTSAAGQLLSLFQMALPGPISLTAAAKEK